MILRISDRYIIRSFLYSFLVCLIMLVSLFVVVDTFSNLPDVVKAWRQSDKGFVQLPLTILAMNAVRMPLILYELSSVLTLSAAMFTIIRLRRANEITPLLASGVSIYRVLWPIFFMAIVLTVVQVADREILIPKYGPQMIVWDRIRDRDARTWRNQTILEDSYDNVIFTGKYFIEPRVQQHAQLTCYWPGEREKVPKIIINALEARWVDAPAPGWVYSRGTAIEYDEYGNVKNQTSFGENGKFIPFFDHRPVRAAAALYTDVTPARIETREGDIFYRPTLYLLEYAHQHGLRADIALDINRRIAAPLTNFILLLIGLPFALRSDMKSAFLGAAVAVGITAAYYAFAIVCENFALQGRVLTPLSGAWAPIIIFGPIGVLLFDSIES